MPAVRVLTPWRRVGNSNEMAVAVDYPAAWADATGQPDEDIASGVDLVIVQGEVSEAQLTAIRADSRYPVIIAGDAETEPADLTAPEVEALRSELAAVVHPDVAKLVTADSVSPVVIADALIEAALHKPWRAGVDVVAGEVYLYERNLYEVIQSHRTQADWHPDRAPALFKRHYEPSDDPWPFVQPTGAHDAYPLGARVLHNGYTWVSTINANVWEPGSVGAEALWTREGEPEPEPVPAWVQPINAETAYSLGAEVMHKGQHWKSTYAGANVWEPGVFGWVVV